MPNDALRAEAAVLASLAGTPIPQVAAEHHLTADEVRGLIHRYTVAGRTALHHPPSPWHQFNLEFAQPLQADSTAAECFLPVLLRAQARQDATWWFLRKPPGWRLRILPGPAATNDPVQELRTALERARTGGLLTRWWCSPYEEETTLFGGETGMALSHDLFTADSTGVAHLLARKPFHGQEPARPLLSLLLMTHLQHAAGLDLNERADVWAKVAAQRPTPAPPGTTTGGAVTAKARVALTTDTTALTPAGELLHPVADWAGGLAAVGARLGTAAHQGRLQRGLRTLLALHVIFHWNRLGITADQQGVWATTAKDALLADT